MVIPRCQVSSSGRVRRCGQYQLIKGEIQPSAKFKPCLPNGAAIDKPQSLVKTNTHSVGRVDAPHENMIILPLRGGDDFLKQTFPNSLSAKARVNVNRMLDRILIGRPCPECAVTSKTHQIAGVTLDSDNRKPTLGLGL